MTDVAQFVVITDQGPIVPSPQNPLSDVHFQNIDLPGLNSRRRAVLQFRLRVQGVAHLTMRFNANPHLIDYNFDPAEPDSTRPRTWHEVFPGTDLQPQNNELVITVTGPGHAVISDIILFYQKTLLDGPDLGQPEVLPTLLEVPRA